ncbi:hypothetical protein EJ07DRAFT_94624 [Lizonia empirigonia]|nr:hypothetical protein EJ07DRAFT_94624 [Lizonia empirigonia]
MSLRSVLLATAAICAYTSNAHMIMKSPVPYSADKVDSAPITADQFPCKFNLGFTVTTMNSMVVGEEQTLNFTGTAVHGGGSCQLSVTTDTTPTTSSKFKVIESIEGGCPGIDGPLDFKFKLPDSIPNGKATFAWTWFAKLSGGPELYMNCAPIEVTGGASDTTAFDALPDMLVANIARTTCKSPTSKALKFPNPGQVLVAGDDGSDVDAPTGECGTTGTSPEPSGGAGGSAAAPVASTQTTLITVTGTPAAPASSTPATGTGTSPAALTTAPAASGGSTCTTDGAIVCNGTAQFGLCNQGKVVWQAVAAGTTCSNGTIQKRGFNGRVVLRNRARGVVGYVHKH